MIHFSIPPSTILIVLALCPTIALLLYRGRGAPITIQASGDVLVDQSVRIHGFARL